MAEISFEDFAGVKPAKPQELSFDQFAGEPPERDLFDQGLDKTVQFLKATGGEGAALADFVLSIPGFMINVGAQLGGTIQAGARGVPFSADPRQLNPVTAYTVGREAGHTFSEPFTNPVKKLLDILKAEKPYEGAVTTQALTKLSSAIESAGKWIEDKSGGQISRDAMPMFIDTFLNSLVGLGPKKGGIDPTIRKRLQEDAIRLRDQAEAEAKARSITPEEFVERMPVQQQINDMLGIRTPQQQAQRTRQRRRDAQQAFARQPEEGGDYVDTAESQFRAEERLRNQRDFSDHSAALEEGVNREPGAGYEVGSRPSDRIGQAEILRIMQKPGHERTAEDLITLREARKQGGNVSPEATMLMGAAGIGATAGALLDDDVLRGATLGGLSAMSPVMLMSMLDAGGVKSRMKQAGAVKEPGGMWHPETVERLANPLKDELSPGRDAATQQNVIIRQALQDMQLAPTDIARLNTQQLKELSERVSTLYSETPEGKADLWANKAIKNYLNKYAGTARDPLKDLEIPFRESTARWEDLVDRTIDKRKTEQLLAPPKEARSGEDIFSWGRPGHQRGAEGSAVESYLSHVGDYLRQNVKPEDLKQYDLTRAVRETHANDLKMAKQMEKAQADSMKDMPVYKEYPDGFKWVELKLPERLTPEQAKGVRELTVAEIKSKVNLRHFNEAVEELKKEGLEVNAENLHDRLSSDQFADFKKYYAVDQQGKEIKNSYTGDVAGGKTPEEAWLAGKLAQEGNIMGHCVGGYCEGVASGESRIFSLRDKQGRSHVTIEVEGHPDIRHREASPQTFFDQASKEFQQRVGNFPGDNAALSEQRAWIQKISSSPEYGEWLKTKPSNIFQIKGKQNRAPNKEYLPYVQDFVRSGKWGEVGDLRETGLVDIAHRLKNLEAPDTVYTRAEKAELDKIGERFVTKEKFDEIQAQANENWAAEMLRRTQALHKASGGRLAPVSIENLRAYAEGRLSPDESPYRTILEAIKLDKQERANKGHYGRQQGFARQELVAGLGAIGLGGILGSWLSDDPGTGGLLGALAGAALMTPAAKRRFKQFAEGADYLGGVISTRIGNVSPALLHRARVFEMRQLTEAHQYLHEVVPFMKALNAIPESSRAAFDRAILTGERGEINRLLSSQSELRNSWPAVRKVLNTLGDQLQGHGRFKTMLDDYFPRLVKDVEGLKNALGTPERTRLEKAIGEAEQAAIKARGTPLTHVELSTVINRELAASRRARGQLPGYARGRTVEEITEQLRPFYFNPSESLYAYVRGAVQDLEMARFFGRDLAQIERGGNKFVDIDVSVGNVVGRELREGKITPAQAQELINILRSRFAGGERTPNRIIQDVRNLGNAGLLGNIVSSVTQFGDAAMSLYAHDLRSTTSAVAKQLSGRERVTPRDFGLADHVAEEFASATKSANALQQILKYAAFTAVDRFGKSTQLNAALSKYERMSRTPEGRLKIQARYGDAYGAEMPQLLTDLQTGTMSERVRSLLFSELSDMQPISKLEVPQGYLDNPNFRLAYMLKTFMLKQFDIVRRDMYQEFKKGHVGTGLKNAAEYAIVLGVSGATVDMVKNWLMGRPADFSGTDVLENVLKTFGWSEYTREKIRQGKPAEALVGVVAPPYRIMDEIIRRDPKAVRYIPVVGKLFYEWELGGREEAELREAKKAKKEGRDYDLSGRAEAYKEFKREQAREKREKNK